MSFKLAYFVGYRKKCKKMHIVRNINEQYRFRNVAYYETNY